MGDRISRLDAAVESLLAHGVPAAAAWDPRILIDHPQLEARGFFEELDHPSIGVHPVPGLPYRFAIGRPLDAPRHCHAGQDNHDVLRRVLGLSDDEIAQLEADEIIGTRPKGL